MTLRSCFVSLTLIATLGCGSPGNVLESPFAGLVGRDDVVTLCNLHPETRSGHDGHGRPWPGKLSTANFQRDGLILAGTPVLLDRLSSRRLTLRVVETDEVFDYDYRAYGTEPFADHLAKVFGTSSPTQEIAHLSRLDRQGIEEGRAQVGMTRRGVWLALGPPPSHENEKWSDRWIYWKDRVDRIAIQFDEDGRVVSIRD